MENNLQKYWIMRISWWSVVRAWYFHCQAGPSWIPGWGTKIPQAVKLGQKKNYHYAVPFKLTHYCKSTIFQNNNSKNILGVRIPGLEFQVVRIPGFHSNCPNSIPGWGSEIPKVAWFGKKNFFYVFQCIADGTVSWYTSGRTYTHTNTFMVQVKEKIENIYKDFFKGKECYDKFPHYMWC